MLEVREGSVPTECKYRNKVRDGLNCTKIGKYAPPRFEAVGEPSG